jgi:sigma-B regulation protein RsbU (phosphoserine phosphatase)
MNTLRSQILCAVTAVMLISSVAIIFFVYFDTNKTVESMEEKYINNVLNFTDLVLTDNYNYLLQSKYEYIENTKFKLKNNVFVSMYMYSSVMESVKSVFGSYSNKDKRKNKIEEEKFFNNSNERLIGMIKKWFDSPQRDKTIEWMILNEEGKILLSTDDSLNGKDVESFYDLTGHKLTEKYHGASLSRSGQFTVFRYQDGANLWKLGYFSPFQDKRTTIVSFVDIKSLAEKEVSLEKEVISDINSIVTGIKIAESGFVFMFSGKKEMIIPPPKENSLFFSGSQLEFLDRLADASSSEKRMSISYSGREYFAYTRYFKGFDWYVSVVLPSSELAAPAKKMIAKIIFVVSVIFVVSMLFFIYLISKYTGPLAILSSKMRKVHKHDFTSDDNSELFDKLPFDAKNEIGQLAETFSYMIEKLSGSIKQLIEKTAANERIETELHCARDIQMGTLPKDFSFEPERKALEIYAYLIPAREIGGDLYDFFFIDEDHLCFSVGDVAGKGIPAAMFMVIAKKLISSNAHKEGAANLSPAEIMKQINEILCKDNPSSTFITLFIGILNVKNGELLYANGGHVPPIFVDCGSEPKYRKDLSGPVVGAMPGIPYKDIATALQPGDAVFLCTDGVTEAMNEDDALFSDKRLLEDFCRMKDKSCKEVVDGILYEVKSHAGKAPQSDDIAMLMVRWGVKEDMIADQQLS